MPEMVCPGEFPSVIWPGLCRSSCRTGARGIKISKKLPLEPILFRKALKFDFQVDPRTATISARSGTVWRDSEHDGLVLAVALAAWWGNEIERCPLG